MPTIPREDLEQLVAAESGPCLTLLMPCYETGPEQQQNHIRFKNLLSEAEKSAGDHRQALRKTFDTLGQLVDDEDFWTHTSAGFAVFSDGKRTRMYQLPQRLPEHAEVADHYAITPVLPSVAEDESCYVLCVSRKHTRLLLAGRDEVAEVSADLPESIAKYEPEAEKAFGMHSFNTRRRDGQYGVPHGHPEEDKEPELRQFFGEIDEALRDAVDSPDAPVVFAGVEELFPLFKEVSQHKGLVGECIAGNPDETQNKELAAKAMELVRPQFDAAADERLQRLHNSMQGDQATADPELIGTAAKQGAIENLFVNREKFTDNPPGRNLSAEEATTLQLLDAVVRQTLSTGGSVFAVPGEKISDADAAAALRYPVADTVPA